MDRGAWWAAVHGVAEGRTRLSNFTFTFHFHALEKEMTTHSSVLAWKIPGMREPSGLPSMGSHRVGHVWSDLAAASYSSTTAQSSSNTASESSGLLFLPFISLWRLPCHIKLILNKYICFSPVWFPWSLSLNTYFFSKFYFSIWEKLLVELQRIRREKWKEFRNQRQKNAESEKWQFRHKMYLLSFIL